MAEEFYRSRYTGEQIDEALGKAMQYKPLTVATDKKLGGVQPVTADKDMVQEVGITPDGKLYTKPTTATGALGLDETLESERMAAPANVVGDRLGECGSAVKGYASGEIVRVDDVSPVAHKAAVKVNGKNLFCSANLRVGHLSLDGSLNDDADYHTMLLSLKKGVYTVSSSSTADVVIIRLMVGGQVSSVTHFLKSASYSFELAEDGEVGLSMRLEPKGGWDDTVEIQLEEGDTATAYEPYVDPATVTLTVKDASGENVATYTPDADGLCMVDSIAPVMTLISDTAGVTIDAEYNRDTNKVLEDVRADLRAIDKALAALAAQTSLVDSKTGKSYTLYVLDGKLMLAESEG